MTALGGYVRLAAALAVFVLGFYFGSLHGAKDAAQSKTAYEALQAAQASNVAKAVLAERASSQAESARINTLLEAYQNAPPDPVVSSVAYRLLERTCPAVGAVPTNPGPASGTRPASGIPRGDPEIEQLTQAALAAAGRDARRLNLCRDAWPHQIPD
jgi:hypothetical protein